MQQLSGALDIPDTLANIASYLPLEQTGKLLSVSRRMSSVSDNVYYIAMERGYPYFENMTLQDLHNYERLTLPELMYQAGKILDRRVIWYWLEHTIGLPFEQLDKEDETATLRAAIGVASASPQTQAVSLLTDIITNMFISPINYCEIAREAAINGHIKVIEIVKDCHNAIAYNAAKYGHKDIIDLLISKGYAGYNYILSAASTGGQYELIQYMLELGADIITCGLHNAIEVGDLRLVNMIVELGVNEDDFEDTDFAAGMGGNMDIIHLMEDILGGLDYNSLLSGAASKGHEDVMDYAISKGGNITEYTIDASIESNKYSTVNKVIDLGGRVEQDDVKEAIDYGNLSIIKLLVNTVYDRSGNLNYTELLEYATNYDNRDIINWLLEQNVKITITSVTNAVEVGNINIILLLLSKSGDNYYSYLRTAHGKAIEERFFRIAKHLNTL